MYSLASHGRPAGCNASSQRRDPYLAHARTCGHLWSRCMPTIRRRNTRESLGQCSGRCRQPCVLARNCGSDLSREGANIIREATQFSPELHQTPLPHASSGRANRISDPSRPTSTCHAQHTNLAAADGARRSGVNHSPGHNTHRPSPSCLMWW
jgi:hypothetical protein